METQFMAEASRVPGAQRWIPQLNATSVCGHRRTSFPVAYWCFTCHIHPRPSPTLRAPPQAHTPTSPNAPAGFKQVLR
ncbi:unnamed protein product [Lota lota]